MAFTKAGKKLQEQMGSRKIYARLERDSYVDGLTENEISFLSRQTSFYLATVGKNDFPYIQHRGGPKGFLKVLDKQRIGFLDFRGNKQYISVGNIATNNKVALIIVDYPSKTRLKVLAKTEIIEMDDDPVLLDLLKLDDYKFEPERIVVFHVEAYDWNCSQHITPRYMLEDIEATFAPQRAYVEKLEAELIELKKLLNL
ncbi:pyridoxamine 5'-phosphate oxidase family protein [Maribacter luteus]|uniref:pyridoxamine 5'-phosphate oxidase family protein n=1 Tax=Maribacter luteus TaxID=2594478 RepID=UPI002490948A|nr:pyridoxamine 5'-phosphate oxidase family protein [Maribacter luteus]